MTKIYIKHDDESRAEQSRFQAFENKYNSKQNALKKKISSGAKPLKTSMRSDMSFDKKTGLYGVKFGDKKYKEAHVSPAMKALRRHQMK